MLLIYGTMDCFKRDYVRESGLCPHCGRVGTLTSYTAREFGHLYYIPLIPDARYRVVMSCRRCRKCYKVRLKEVPEKIAGLLVDGMTAARAGDVHGAADAFAALMHFGGFAEVEEVLHELESVEGGRPSRLLRASAAQMRGDLLGAEEQYRAQVQVAPADWETRRRLGDLLAGNRDLLAAAEEYRAIAEGNPQDAGVRVRLADVLENLKMWDAMVVTLEEACAIEPAFTQNKVFDKRLGAARKKAARTPRAG